MGHLKELHLGVSQFLFEEGKKKHKQKAWPVPRRGNSWTVNLLVLLLFFGIYTQACGRGVESVKKCFE